VHQILMGRQLAFMTRSLTTKDDTARIIGLVTVIADIVFVRLCILFRGAGDDACFG
jgi:hypothetical protein